MGPRRIHLIVASALVLALLLSGCAKPALTSTPATTLPTTSVSTTTPPTKTSAPGGPYGELTLILTSFGDETFNPIKVSAWNSLTEPAFDHLLRVKGSELAPGVAEKWELSPDGGSWIFSLRKGIKFHNGEDLKADDVKFSLDLHMSKDAIYTDLAKAVERVEVVDDYTIRAYTRGAQPFLPWLLTTAYTPAQGRVLPKDYLEANGMDYFLRRPVASGSFKFVRHLPADLVEYEAVTDHWRQTPAFKKLTMIAIPEETTKIAMLKTGQGDIINTSLEGSYELEQAGFKVLPMAGEESLLLVHGAYSPAGAGMPVSDLRVRQALSLAVDRTELMNVFFYGKASPALPSCLSEVSADIDVDYWKKYAAEQFRYDPEEAKKLIKEAGYPNGFKIKLYALFGTGSPPFLRKLSEIVAGYWTKVGVTAELVPLEMPAWKAIRDEMKNPNTEAIGRVAVYSASRYPNTPRRLAWFDSRAGYAILNNKFPEVDKGLDQALSELDTTKRREILAKVIKTTADSYTIIGICGVPSMIALGPNADIDLTGLPGTSDQITIHLANVRHRN